MRCLSCQKTVAEAKAVYTKPCHHVFCLQCSSKRFQEELICPRCDTVLPKDGIIEINIRPDRSAIQKASEPGLGMQPKHLCQILQNGLEFWAQQQRNENSIHLQTQKKVKDNLEEEKSLNRKLKVSLENERMRSTALTRENEDLMFQVSELEKRITEKSRLFRKLDEKYNELRSVHKKLESDLRGTQIDTEHRVDESIHWRREKGKRDQDVSTRRQSKQAEDLSGVFEATHRPYNERHSTPSAPRSVPLSMHRSARGSVPSGHDARFNFKLDSKRSRQGSVTQPNSRPPRGSLDGRDPGSIPRRGDSTRYEHKTRDRYD